MKDFSNKASVSPVDRDMIGQTIVHGSNRSAGVSQICDLNGAGFRATAAAVPRVHDKSTQSLPLGSQPTHNSFEQHAHIHIAANLRLSPDRCRKIP